MKTLAIHDYLLQHILDGIPGACPSSVLETWALGCYGRQHDEEGLWQIPCTPKEAEDLLTYMQAVWDFPNLGNHELDFLAATILLSRSEA